MNITPVRFQGLRPLHDNNGPALTCYNRELEAELHANLGNYRFAMMPDPDRRFTVLITDDENGKDFTAFEKAVDEPLKAEFPDVVGNMKATPEQIKPMIARDHELIDQFMQSIKDRIEVNNPYVTKVENVAASCSSCSLPDAE
jgi:hypothetical protein